VDAEERHGGERPADARRVAGARARSAERVGPPQASASEVRKRSTGRRHLAVWLMPSEPLDLFGTGPFACGDLDPGAPQTKLHMTLASGTATWEQGRAGLARVAAALAGEGLLPIEAALAEPRTSTLARMRTHVPLAFERDPRPLARAAFAETLASTAGSAAPSAREVLPHLTLSYRAEHACPPLAARATWFEPLWLVDLGDGDVLDVVRWRLVAAHTL